MADIYTWERGVTGDWGDAADWAGGETPNSTLAIALIAGPGTDVGIGTAESFTVGGLTLGTRAAFSISGELSLTGGIYNLATIDLTGGTLDLLGIHTLSHLGSIKSTDGGEVEVSGLLNLAGGTVTAAGGFSNTVVDGGTLANGTLSLAGTEPTLIDAHLKDITVAGTNQQGYVDLNLTATNSPNTVFADGLSFDDREDGYLAFEPASNAETLVYQDSETLNAGTVYVGNHGGFNEIKDTTGTLTIGSLAVVTDGNSTDGASLILDGNIINEGNIVASYAPWTISGAYFLNSGPTISIYESTLDITATNFDNQGYLSASESSIVTGEAALDVNDATFQNSGKIIVLGNATIAANNVSNSGDMELAGNSTILSASFGLDGTLTGGSYDVAGTIGLPNGSFGPTATLVLPNTIDCVAAHLIVNDGVLIAGGKNIEQSLTSIASSGSLLLAGLSSNNTITDAGNLTVGLLDVPLITIEPGATFSGFQVDAPMVNDGFVDTQFSTFEDSISGTGILFIAPENTFALAASQESSNISFGAGSPDFDTQLKLQAPRAYTGTLVGLAPGNAIDLEGLIASSATISGSDLLITLSAGGTLSYALSAASALAHATVASDGAGGTDIIILQASASSAAQMSFLSGAASPAVETDWSAPVLLQPVHVQTSAALAGVPTAAAHAGLHAETMLLPTTHPVQIALAH